MPLYSGFPVDGVLVLKHAGILYHLWFLSFYVRLLVIVIISKNNARSVQGQINKHVEFCTESLLWPTCIAGNNKMCSSLRIKNIRDFCMIVTKFWAARNIFIMLSSIMLQSSQSSRSRSEICQQTERPTHMKKACFGAVRDYAKSPVTTFHLLRIKTEERFCYYDNKLFFFKLLALYFEAFAMLQNWSNFPEQDLASSRIRS